MRTGQFDSFECQEFIETYAKPGLPVIITGLNMTQKDRKQQFGFFGF